METEMKNHGLSQTAFAKKIGANQKTINNMFLRHTNPSYENICAILNAFPEVDSDWLLFGGDFPTPDSPLLAMDLTFDDYGSNISYRYSKIIKNLSHQLSIANYRIVKLSAMLNRNGDIE
jgi:transcriptional regulator with XRE-family HTH domain